MRPHAVSSIPGVGSYQYDGNGNLEIGPNGTRITWTNFDMPVRMEKNGKSSDFVYGPEHQRLKQTRSNGTRQYYSGAIEAEITGDGDIVRTYWPLGVGFEVDNVRKGTKETYWVHKDNLGSVVGISGADGSLREKMAYDVWGKRRGLDGAPIASTPAGAVDHRGFTGHEMLDDLELVHMNARIYDPVISRFISADSLIQDPEHSQSYNRYSYVWNNPASLTDPTGLEAVEEYPNEKKLRSAVNRACSNYADKMTCASKIVREYNSVYGNGARAANSEVAGPNNSLESKAASANNGTSNQPEKNHGGHWAEYKRDVPSSGGDGPSTNATGYDDWARGKGYMTQEQWNERAAARGAGAAIGVGAVATGAVVVEAPAIGAGIAAGFKRLFGLGKVEVQFGRVDNQINHTFRHIDKAGLDRNAVQQAVRQDVSRAAESLSKGQQHTGSVVVNGTRVEYSAFKLQDGTINVGRITPPRQ